MTRVKSALIQRFEVFSCRWPEIVVPQRASTGRCLPGGCSSRSRAPMSTGRCRFPQNPQTARARRACEVPESFVTVTHPFHPRPARSSSPGPHSTTRAPTRDNATAGTPHLAHVDLRDLHDHVACRAHNCAITPHNPTCRTTPVSPEHAGALCACPRRKLRALSLAACRRCLQLTHRAGYVNSPTASWMRGCAGRTGSQRRTPRPLPSVDVHSTGKPQIFLAGREEQIKKYSTANAGLISGILRLKCI